MSEKQIAWAALATAVAALFFSLYHWHNGGGRVHIGTKA